MRSWSISRRNVVLSTISNSFALFMLTLPVKILWMQQFLSNSQISILTGGLFLSIVILELPTGAIADLIGKRKTVFAGYFLLAISALGMIFAQNFWQFGLVMLLQGLGESLESGAREALVFDSLKQDGREKEYRAVFANVITAVQFSMTAATFLGGWLGLFDLRLPFLIHSVFLFLGAGLVLLMKEPIIDTEKFDWESYKRQTIDGTKHLFRSVSLAKIALLYMAVGGVGWVFQRLLKDMILIEVGYQPFEIGLIGGAFRLINILLLAKIIRSKWLLESGWDFLVMPVIMALAYLPGIWLNQWVAIPVVAGITIVGTGRFMVLAPHLQDRVESRYRSTAISAANLLVSVVLAANMFGVGFLIEWVGIRNVTTFYGLISLLVVVPLAWSVRQDHLRTLPQVAVSK